MPSTLKIMKDFDGSARREAAAELSFRWKTWRRTDASFRHAVSLVGCHVSENNESAPA